MVFNNLLKLGKAWYEHLSNFLLENDFEIGNVEKTLFRRNHNFFFIIVQIYVDNIIFGAINELLCKEFSELMQMEFEMSMMGELRFFLGLHIEKAYNKILIHQSKYIKELLKR